MLERNKVWMDKVRGLGGKTYPIGGQRYGPDEWREHYGDTWDDVVRAKKLYDPARILTPGPRTGIRSTRRRQLPESRRRRDRREHRVSDAAFHQGQGIGNHAALCGHVVAPLSTAEPSGPPCRECPSASRVAVAAVK
ncbi:hypothetical protein [Allokutzneria albata]|uniref:hypothetical protein n=1 Tax=Allokutzneria albata TaxID=211114 RepID=UPI0009F17A34|nr:hypothetical protein [Allokutzneria albata]